MHQLSPHDVLHQTIYSDDVGLQRRRVEEQREKSPSNYVAQDYLEASFAANIPSFPLSDPFQQAANYTNTVYLAIQHLMQAMSGVSAGLEIQSTNKNSQRKNRIAQGGAQFTDQNYEPFTDHPLANIIQKPNPIDTFVDFVCQCIMNWNLHGRLLIWARPNNVGAPIRFYCLPVPLCVPAFHIGTPQFPLGAWRIQQYYPTTGITGILPQGLMGSAGAYIDSREVYEMKNPHPVYRWAPYSHLLGGDSAIDIIQNIDLSFWSIMSQGPKPAGIIDAPGADESQVTAVQNKIDNAHGGARQHGRPVVIGGGDPERPAIKWTPLTSLVPEALHEGGWEIFTSFVLAIFGLDMTAVGLRRSGGHAERWAARRDERDTLTSFLSRLAATLTHGGLVKQWGLLKKGVRVIINLPDLVGYDPAEMSKDLSTDGTGTYNEVRHLRGLKGAEGLMEEFGDLPVPLALKMAEKKLGIDQQTQDKQMMQEEAKLNPAPQSTDETRNNPDNNRPETPDEAKGSLGGEGSGTPKAEIKAVMRRVLNSPVILNGFHE